MKTIDQAKGPKTTKKAINNSLYNISINSLDGKQIDLSEFKGKTILFVNVASQCGFTSQYKGLQQLSDTYPDELVVIGCPCNQFGQQEPGDATQIRSFCTKNFGVTFLLTEKLDVKGPKQHPLYSWLTKAERNGLKSSSVKWNFQKYLVDKEGKLIDYYYSLTKPLSKKITRHL